MNEIINPSKFLHNGLDDVFDRPPVSDVELECLDFIVRVNRMLLAFLRSSLDSGFVDVCESDGSSTCGSKCVGCTLPNASC